MRTPATAKLRFRPSSNNASSVVSPISSETARFHQKLTLSNGRTLGYAEYGNPTDYPLLYFHGYPSSRLEGWGFHKWPEIHGFRLIVPDRPGFGLSSYQPNRQILDWPADVEALVSHLGLSRFAILGCSGGGPYAIACAYLLSAHMLSAVGVMAGAPPWVAGIKDVTVSRKLLSCAATYCPRTLEMVLNPLCVAFRWILESGPVTKWLDNWIDGMKREKRANGQQDAKDESLSTEEARKRMLSTSFEAFAQGSGAAVQEARLLSQDWGFRFQDLSYSGIRIWHGTKDVNASIEMVRYMVKRLPRPVFHELEEDHYTMGHHLEAAIVDLIGNKTGKDNDGHC
ncbi:hypothetical protein N7494_009335 [Penicillium frequentans]|uniref:AB hydrolase-1 domain-containing protein n=1 Tax=Penicillium frequentans TaxID=3151616 RepID=A0AAD6CSH3_9EURO|nr:hypothetical protein N7494_009335 [Penicillium glabrum]